MSVKHTPIPSSLTSENGTSPHATVLNQTHKSNVKLGWILIHKRWISSAQLQTTLTQQHDCPKNSCKKIGELLLEQSLLSPAQLKQALQEQYWRRNGYWVI